MVIEDLERFLVPLEQSELRRIVLLLGDAENLGETRTPQLKSRITL